MTQFLGRRQFLGRGPFLRQLVDRVELLRQLLLGIVGRDRLPLGLPLPFQGLARALGDSPVPLPTGNLMVPSRARCGQRQRIDAGLPDPTGCLDIARHQFVQLVKDLGQGLGADGTEPVLDAVTIDGTKLEDKRHGGLTQPVFGRRLNKRRARKPHRRWRGCQRYDEHHR